MSTKARLRQQGYDWQMPQEPSRKPYLTPEKIRKMAKESRDGGRAMCEICRESFGMYYIKWVKITPFRSGHVCADCQREKGFQKAK